MRIGIFDDKGNMKYIDVSFWSLVKANLITSLFLSLFYLVFVLLTLYS